MPNPTKKPQQPSAEDLTAVHADHDTRRSPRATCDLPMEYQLPGTGPRNGRITKLGTLGALVTTQETVPVGAELQLRFDLPLSKRRVNALAKVRWTAHGRAGVEFSYLGLQQRDEIWQYYALQSARKRVARS